MNGTPLNETVGDRAVETFARLIRCRMAGNVATMMYRNDPKSRTGALYELKSVGAFDKFVLTIDQYGCHWVMVKFDESFLKQNDIAVLRAS